MRFELIDTPLEGLKLLKREQIRDGRGAFSRLFCAEQLQQLGWQHEVAQSNFSHTSGKGTIRGLHYQLPPSAEKKLVTCISGTVFDVAVDLRQKSETFGHWFGAELGAGNAQAMLIPEGFAHGFQALDDDVMMIYFHSQAYAPETERGLIFNDPTVGIEWPLTPVNLSQRDQMLPDFETLGKGVVL